MFSFSSSNSTLSFWSESYLAQFDLLFYWAIIILTIQSSIAFGSIRNTDFVSVKVTSKIWAGYTPKQTQLKWNCTLLQLVFPMEGWAFHRQQIQLKPGITGQYHNPMMRLSSRETFQISERMLGNHPLELYISPKWYMSVLYFAIL